MLLKMGMKDLAKLRKIYEDYASLKISFEIFEHNVQSFMKFSKSKTDNEKKVSIDYAQQGKVPKFRVNVSTPTVVNVLKKYLENQISIKELENWASTLLMDNDHFAVADDEPSARQSPAFDALHQVASWADSLSRQDIEGYVARIKENS